MHPCVECRIARCPDTQLMLVSFRGPPGAKRGDSARVLQECAPETGPGRAQQLLRLPSVCFRRVEVAAPGREHRLQNRSRGHPHRLSRFLTKPDGFCGTSQSAYPVARLDLRAATPEKHARQITQTSLLTERRARCGQPTDAEIIRADRVGNGAQDPHDHWILDSRRGVSLKLPIYLMPVLERPDIPRNRNSARIVRGRCQLVRGGEDACADGVARIAPPTTLRSTPQKSQCQTVVSVSPRIDSEARQRGNAREIVDGQRLADLANPRKTCSHVRLGLFQVRLAQQALHCFRLAEGDRECGRTQQSFALCVGSTAQSRRALQRDDGCRQRAAPLRSCGHLVQLLCQSNVRSDRRCQAVPYPTIRCAVDGASQCRVHRMTRHSVGGLMDRRAHE